MTGNGLRVGLIGAGRQGVRRAQTLQKCGATLVVVADPTDRASELAQELSCEASGRWENVVVREDIDVVVVSTPPDLHATISIAALNHGKHVLCEKPLARTPEEASEIVRVAQEKDLRLKCGFNLRHHPGITQVRSWVDQGLIGDLMFIRCIYGIGGRAGYEKDWRTQSEISGGGQLMDQGVHALDLARWFLGDFSEVFGVLQQGFWDTPVEDNAFCLLRTEKGQVASIHASWTQWKNRFSLEIFGKDGYVIADGLGDAYGVERAIWGRRAFDEPFQEQVIEFRRSDISWEKEWQEFTQSIMEHREPLGNGVDGAEAIRLAHAIYEASRQGSPVNLRRS